LVRQLQDQNDALRSAVDDNRHRSEATADLLRNAIARDEGTVFRPDVEMEKLNSQRMSALADAIAKKVQPEIPGPKTPDELRADEDEQVERITSRMVEKMEPVLLNVSKGQHFATDEAVRKEFERNQRLSSDLIASQAVAQDALKTSHEIGALYVGSFENQGVLPRILSLPGGVVHDAVSFSIISSSDRKKAQQDVQTKRDQIQKRMDEIQAEAMSVKS
jgi:hypothetical protein